MTKWPTANATACQATADRHGTMARRRSPRAGSEQALLCRYGRRGEVATRDELVERFLPLARGLASRYSREGESIEDLVQVACGGLLKAIDRYDPARGIRFTSYATPTIMGELKRYFLDCGRVVHVPRGLQERALAMNRIADGLAAERGRSPTPQEITAPLGCALKDVAEALERPPATARSRSTSRSRMERTRHGSGTQQRAGGRVTRRRGWMRDPAREIRGIPHSTRPQPWARCTQGGLDERLDHLWR